jgi:muramoyltetrapeptide carboxypeptidase LdcA involved in peptidoglycan recycling
VIRPPALRPGDRVAAISLSWGGAHVHPHRYQAGKRQMEEEFGVRVVETPHALRDPDWLRRNPAARADDLMGAFADPGIAAVVSIIGGDESIRVLPFLDLDVIRENPKILLGFSDTSITHWACFRAGLVSFYGTSVMTGFAENGGMFRYTADSVRRTLFDPQPPGTIGPSKEGWTAELLDWAEPANQFRRRTLNPPEPWRFLQGTGIARGRLIGGCLEVIEFLRGTEWWPAIDAWNGAILFLETSEEAPHPRVLERALRTYAAMGILRRLSGVIFGRPYGAADAAWFDDHDRALVRVVAEEEGLTELPIVTRMDFGHTDPTFVLPHGGIAEIDCVAQRFSIVEAAVVG